MKKNLFLMASLAMLFMFSSCATILSGKKQKIVVNGNVDNPVQLIVDGQVYNSAKLPVKVPVKRKAEPSKIIAFTDNYELELRELDKTFNPVILGNLIFPSFAVVDWLSGANKKTTQKEIYLEFRNVCTTDAERSNSYNDFGVECFNTNSLNTALFYFQKAKEIDPANELFTQNITAVQNRVAYLEEQRKQKAQRDEAMYSALMGIGTALNTAGNNSNSSRTSSNFGSNSYQSSNNDTSSKTNSSNTKPLSSLDCNNYRKSYNEGINTVQKIKDTWVEDSAYDAKNNTNQIGRSKQILRAVLQNISEMKKNISGRACTIQYNNGLETWAKNHVN
jgi:hypothetical protein